jgi:CRP-like cAMP-binding protein
LDHIIYLELKRKIEEYVHPNVEEWNDFSSKWKPKSFKKNEYLTKGGQIEKYFYFVNSGVIRLFGEREDNEINVGFTYNGEFSGIYDSFLSQTPTDLFLQAITDCEVLRISYQDLMSQFDMYKSIERWGRLFNAEMLILMARRQIESRSYSAEEKFNRLFEASPHIFQLVPQKYLASYLAMTPETFSRLRKKLK